MFHGERGYVIGFEYLSRYNIAKITVIVNYERTIRHFIWQFVGNLHSESSQGRRVSQQFWLKTIHQLQGLHIHQS